MTNAIDDRLRAELAEIENAGLYKGERLMTSPQSGQIVVVRDGQEVDIINLCANNYLGLADNAAIREAAKAAIDRYGYGMASVRFICGTLDLHRRLEKTIAQFTGHADAITYAACFDANGGVFEPLLSAEDAIISESINHA